MNDLDYRKYMIEMRNVSGWYNKYAQHGKPVDIPKTD